MNSSVILFRKFLMIIPSVLILSFLSFSVVYFAPGSAGKLLLGAKNQRGFISDSNSIQYEKRLGIDKPFGELYMSWLTSLAKGHLGYSYMTRESVFSIFVKRFSITFKLAILTMLIYILLGIPIGMTAAVKEHTICRLLLKYWRIICMSVPPFWVGIILLWSIANYAPAIPSIGYHGIKSLLIPALLMGSMSFSNLTCIIQNKTESLLSKQFIFSAQALGIPKKIIFTKHILKNIAAPAIAVSCIDFGSFIGGAILIENIFSIPGLGLMLTNAINVKDYPVIAGTLFLLGLFVNIFNFIADILYCLIDKRGFAMR